MDSFGTSISISDKCMESVFFKTILLEGVVRGTGFDFGLTDFNIVSIKATISNSGIRWWRY